MDVTKCNALKRELAMQEEPQLVSIDRFFDGNDDEGSIGCNLMKHPGVDTFRRAFEDLKRRESVQSIYAQITELDPGEDSWPFTDTIVVVGSITPEELQKALAGLEPDEVGPGGPDFLSPALSEADKSRALVAWWD